MSNIEKFLEMVQESDNIVFLGEQVFLPKVASLTSGVWMDSIIRNMIIHRRRY